MFKALKKVLACTLAAAVTLGSAGVASAAQSPTQSVQPEKNASVKVSNVTVSTTEKGTATLKKIAKTNKKSVVVASKVKVDGVTYTVTTINANAFANCKKATKVTIPATIKTIKKNAFKGARNDALRLARGDYFALVDDDAVYSSDYLEKCGNTIKKEKKVIISGRIRGNDIEESDFIDYSVANEGERLSFEKIRRICPSAGLVFPISVIKECGLFDVNFGLGAYFGAAEETDLLLRALRKKYIVIHTKEAILKHPIQLQMSCEKALSYARGGGALVKKHLIYFHDFRLLIGGIRLFLVPFIKMLLFFFKKEKRLVEYNRLKGFFDGFIRYKRELMDGIEG